MKTFSRMVRRYIGAAFLIVLAVFLVNAALFIGIVLYIGVQAANGSIPAESISLSDIRQLADSFFLDSDGTPFPSPASRLIHTGLNGPCFWMKRAASFGTIICPIR